MGGSRVELGSSHNDAVDDNLRVESPLLVDDLVRDCVQIVVLFLE